MVRTELYFGLARPDGGQVSEAEFSDFMYDVISGDLPEGFTLFDAYGQFMQADGVMLKEKTKMLIFFHQENNAESAAIEDVVSSYRERFGGAKVMRSTSVADVRFYVD